jgi:hypothetical protein
LNERIGVPCSEPMKAICRPSGEGDSAPIVPLMLAIFTISPPSDGNGVQIAVLRVVVRLLDPI